MACSKRNRTAGNEAPIASVFFHPSLWDYLGKGRYLQAAASKSLARGYSDRFGTSTVKVLSNVAARSESRTFLDWTRSIGCKWDESVFLSGVQGGRTEILQHLVDNECPVPQGEDACTCAAKEGRLEALMWLREREFAWGKAVCTEAAARGDLPMLQWARQHECVCDSREVLERAARAGHLNILEWARKQGVQLFAWLTVQAAAGGRLHVLEWLRAQNCPAHDGAVWYAALYGHCGTLVWLKKNGCPYNANVADTQGRTALQMAAGRGHIGTVKTLIEDGADVNEARNVKQITALFLAATFGSFEIAQMLIRAGACVNVQAIDLTTPLLAAVKKGSLDVVKLLLRAGANTELSDEDGFLPLTVACRYNRVEIVQALLVAGANYQTAKFQPPLHLSCQRGHVDVVRALIDWRADVNASTESEGRSGIRPIHMAAQEGHAHVVAILVRSGADVNVVTSEGQTPLYIAHAHKHLEVVKILLARLAPF